MIYKPKAIRPETYILLEKCKKVFLEIYPEFDMINISINKVLYEVMKHYLKNTKFDVLDEKEKKRLFKNEI